MKQRIFLAVLALLAILPARAAWEYIMVDGLQYENLHRDYYFFSSV